MEAVRKQIDEDTEKVAGKNKSISNVPLRLRFYSKNVVDLLLVDLPGMTKVTPEQSIPIPSTDYSKSIKYSITLN